MGNNFKFFAESSIDDNASFDFTSSSATLTRYLYDNNYNTRLVSSGSNDATPEIYTISFAATITATAIFLGYNNFKNFTIQYSDDDQGSWSDFSSAIAETANAVNYNFYEFTEVSGITDLRVTANTTITTNAEKQLGQLRIFFLIGEVSANPYNITNPYNENSVVHELGDGGNVYVQFGKKILMTIDFDDATEADSVIFRTLKDRYAPFYTYPNGGLSTRTQEPFRVQDMFLTNYVNPYEPNIRNGFLLDIGTEISLELQEV